MSDFPPANLSVLIVDDQTEIHHDFQEMLTNPPRRLTPEGDLDAPFFSEVLVDTYALPLDFNLVHATSGEQACEIVAQSRRRGEPIAVAYIDLRMAPGIDGIETVQRVRRLDREIEVVLMTAHSDHSLPDILRDVDLLHKLLYIRKPFVYEEIQQLTLSLVGKWNIERKLMDNQALLVASHRRLEAVLEATGDAIAMLDSDRRPVFSNAIYRDLVGLSESELQNLSGDELAARCRQRFRDPDLHDAEDRSPLAHGNVVEARHEDRQNQMLHHSTASVRDGQGQVIGTLVVYRDISREIEAERMKAEVQRLRSDRTKSISFSGIVGSSSGMQKLYELVRQGAEGDITVLIMGESGTGKELVARALHSNGGRSAGPFVAVDCASIPESLIESELFGHERGSFTGADTQRVGAFERADGGTILLDEIGDMPYPMQTRLLRVLQEREVRRLGGNAAVSIDIRVVAATNRDLESAVAAGEFREDLFYRISAFPISIPPLRERREDIALLANHFLEKHGACAGKSIGGISAAAMGALVQYEWPGNVRELENSIERGVLLCDGSVLQAGHLPAQLGPAKTTAATNASSSGTATLVELERAAIANALEVADHNLTHAARSLGVSRGTVYRKVVKYGLSRP